MTDKLKLEIAEAYGLRDFIKGHRDSFGLFEDAPALAAAYEAGYSFAGGYMTAMREAGRDECFSTIAGHAAHDIIEAMAIKARGRLN
jgi:hypothetical protein